MMHGQTQIKCEILKMVLIFRKSTEVTFVWLARRLHFQNGGLGLNVNLKSAILSERVSRSPHPL